MQAGISGPDIWLQLIASTQVVPSATTEMTPLRAGFAAAPVARVRLEETSLNSFEYRGEEGRTP